MVPNETPLTPPEQRIAPQQIPEAPATPRGDRPKVESYDVDIHVVQVNDSFRSISQRYYLDESYERALRKYNIDGAYDGSGGPDRMQPGVTKIAVPPIRVLQQKYPELLPGGQANTNAASTSNAPQVNNLLGQPQSINPSSAFREYRVPEPGQTIREVARQTLGSGESWRNIWSLNTRLNPNERVPAGTMLRLPAEAVTNRP